MSSVEYPRVTHRRMEGERGVYYGKQKRRALNGSVNGVLERRIVLAIEIYKGVFWFRKKAARKQ